MAIKGEPRRGKVRVRTSVMLGFTLLLLVLGGLRFARADLAGTGFFASDEYYTWTTDDGRYIENLNIDISQYLAMVEDYRGVEGAFEKQEPYPAFEASGDAVSGPVDPFTHRVALPWLASLLPLDSSYAFALVNLAFLTLGLWLLVDALATSGRSPTAQVIGAALYTVALPVVVFASSLFIDGGVVGVLVIGYWLMVRRWWWALLLFFPISYLVKEALLVLAPAAIWAWRTSGHRFRDPRFVAGVIASSAGVLAAAWWVSDMAPEPVMSFTVMPTWQYTRWNLTNLTSAVFVIVGVSTVAIPAFLGIKYLLSRASLSQALRGPSGADLVGIAAVLLMNVYSIVSTDFTLRTGWLLWPFAIALGAVWVDQNVDLRKRLDPLVAAKGSQPVPA